MEPRSTNVQQAQNTSQRPDWTCTFPRITPMKSPNDKSGEVFLGDFLYMVRANNLEDLLGAILALSIFGSFSGGMIWFPLVFLPRRHSFDLRFFHCWYELV